MATVQPSETKKPWSDWWERQPAGRRKSIMTLLVLGGVLAFAYFLVSGPGATTPDKPSGKMDNALIPADDARDLGVNGVNLDVKKSNDRERNLEGEVGRLTSQLNRYTQANGESEGSKDQKLQATVEEMRTELEQMKAAQAAGATSAPQASGFAGAPGAPGAAAAVAPPPAAPPPYGPIRTIGQADNAATPGPGASSTASVRPSTLEAKHQAFYLPSGSFVQAVLLTGVEAPTGHAAQRDPVPVLARIKHDAILPNFFRADVRECFVLLDTIGDLASERAMMRSENISCVLKDKSVIDVPIQGYGVGEDGKAGLRGILVSKQGMALRKAMLAGFADGISKAFGAQSQPSLLGTPGQSVNYQQTLQSGAMGGASSAMDRIAQYYLDLASELHPVIEIESGRQITLVVLHGRTLATVDQNAPPSNANDTAQQQQQRAGQDQGGGSTSPAYH